MKVLMLVLANDGGPKDLYTRLQVEIWRRYMHTKPDEIHAYFYKANPNLSEDYLIEGDTVYVKCEEQYPLLWKKLWLVLKVFGPTLDEYDFVCRPDLSSFFILDKYLNYLETVCRQNTCTAYINKEPTVPDRFPTGAGFTITPDIAKYIIKNKIIPNNEGIDDVTMGLILKHLKSQMIPYPMLHIHHAQMYERLSIVYNNIKTEAVESGTGLFAQGEIFHIRIKHHWSTDRTEEDLLVHHLLLEHVYGEK
uniref:Glycosyltransferase n=1 Tax=viral metagenome TaxID=1070528 RepID=A0A6C0KUR5_9ZZZZ